MQLMGTSRPSFASADRTAGNPDEVVAAFNTYHAYFSVYSVDLASSPPCVLHHIQVRGSGELSPSHFFLLKTLHGEV